MYEVPPQLPLADPLPRGFALATRVVLTLLLVTAGWGSIFYLSNQRVFSSGLAVIICLLIAGALVGAGQRRLWWRSYPYQLRWWLLSAVGWLVATGLTGILPEILAQLLFFVAGPIPLDVLHFQTPSLGVYLLSAIIGGTVLAGAQWLLLRRLYPRVAWWVPLNAGCWVAGYYATRTLLLGWG